MVNLTHRDGASPDTLRMHKMEIWINEKFDLDTDCTNVQYATGARPAGDNWVPGTKADIAGSAATQLYLQAGTRYFGFM